MAEARLYMESSMNEDVQSDIEMSDDNQELKNCLTGAFHRAIVGNMTRHGMAWACQWARHGMTCTSCEYFE